MKSYFVLLPILILAALESSIVSAHLVLLAIISWSVLRPRREGLLTAFIAGLILDFLTGRTLGLTSLVFLFLSLLVYLYKNRFQANRLAFLLPFTLFSLIAIDLLEGLPALSIKTVIIEGVNTILVVFLLPLFNFFSKISQEKEQLKLSFEEKL